jgi:hypothetical protein
MIWIAVDFHKYFSKIHFFIKQQHLLLSFYEYFRKEQSKKRISNIFASIFCFLSFG